MTRRCTRMPWGGRSAQVYELHVLAQEQQRAQGEERKKEEEERTKEEERFKQEKKTTEEEREMVSLRFDW